MEITDRFARTLKILLICAIFMFCYNCALSLYGMSGISISNPGENTTLRIWFNKVYRILGIVIFWGSIGYLIKDYKAAGAAFLLSFLLLLGIPTSTFQEQMGIKFYLFNFTHIFPFWVFGLIHFKNTKGLYLGVAWLILWGLSIGQIPHLFSNFLEFFGKLFGVRNLFLFRFQIDSNTSRGINIFYTVYFQCYLFVEVIVFWWVYEKITKGENLFTNLMTIHLNPMVNKLTYSIIYWSMRLTLFVTSFGVATYIGSSFTKDFDLMVILRVGLFCFSLIMIASIYRNFLVGRFVENGKYPSGTYLFLNIPIINVFAWIYSLLSLKNQSVSLEGKTYIDDTSLIKKLQDKFVIEGKNGIWKGLFVIFTFCHMVYQLNRAGFRIDGPSRDGSVILLISFLISFFLLLWFLASRHSYFPLLILLTVNIVLVTALRQETYFQTSVASSMVNIVLYFGLFHFDHLKWDLPSQVGSEEEE